MKYNIISNKFKIILYIIKTENNSHIIIYFSFTAGTILNDTIYIKKNNLNTNCKNLSISANVNLAFRNVNISKLSRNGNEFNFFYDLSSKS